MFHVKHFLSARRRAPKRQNVGIEFGARSAVSGSEETSRLFGELFGRG
jgi:hypothetical protein